MKYIWQRFYKKSENKRVIRERIGSIKDLCAHVYVEPQEMDELFNEHFSCFHCGEAC